MNRLLSLVLTTLILSLWAVPQLARADQLLLSLGSSTNFAGTSTVKGYEKWILVDSISFGSTRTAAVIGGGAGAAEVSPATLSEISLTKAFDAVSVALWQAALNGKAISKVRIVQVDSMGKPVFEIDLANVLLTSYSAGAASERPYESFTLNFASMKYLYQEKTSTTSAAPAVANACWDLAMSTPDCTGL